VSDPTLSQDKQTRNKPGPSQVKNDKPRDSSTSSDADKGKQRLDKPKERSERQERPEQAEVEKPERKEWVDKGDKSNKGRRKERPSINVPTEEYDFETANAKFVREEQEEEQSPAYVKSSFFDDISSDIKDRFDNKDMDRRAHHKQEKNLNMETFGQAAPRYQNRRGRGRGRGRGGGRGRGRGGAGHESHGDGNTA
jgi:protein LSM14